MYKTAAHAAFLHHGANWAVEFVATVSACKGADRAAIGLLTTRHEPPLEDWMAEFFVARNMAAIFPDRARKNFADAVSHCPKQHLELLERSALTSPPLAAAIQNNKN